MGKECTHSNPTRQSFLFSRCPAAAWVNASPPNKLERVPQAPAWEPRLQPNLSVSAPLAGAVHSHAPLTFVKAAVPHPGPTSLEATKHPSLPTSFEAKLLHSYIEKAPSFAAGPPRSPAARSDSRPTFSKAAVSQLSLTSFEATSCVSLPTSSEAKLRSLTAKNLCLAGFERTPALRATPQAEIISAPNFGAEFGPFPAADWGSPHPRWSTSAPGVAQPLQSGRGKPISAEHPPNNIPRSTKPVRMAFPDVYTPPQSLAKAAAVPAWSAKAIPFVTERYPAHNTASVAHFIIIFKRTTNEK